MNHIQKQYKALLEKRRPQIHMEVLEWLSGALNQANKPYKKQRRFLRGKFREYFLNRTAKHWPADQVQIAKEEFETVFNQVEKWG